MDDELVAQFVAITDASSDKARQYLNISDNDVNQAIELFFNTGGIDLAETATDSTSSHPPPVPPPQTRPRREDDVVNLDSDDADEDPEIIESRPRTRQPAQEPSRASAHDDEAMARRLQEEFFSRGSGSGSVDAEGYRAPIARTTETLVGPGSMDMNDPDEMRAAVMEQMRMRPNRQRVRNGGPGIFNQHASPSIWNEAAESSTESHQEALARATGGASKVSSKTNMLAEMYRPPFELMARVASWEAAREEGKENQKWILVNIQDSSIFDCQLLNRDIWKDESIKETVRENFLFLQYSKDDPRGAPYVRYYFQDSDSQDAYPHIAIVDPRTGEQVKKWSGRPPPRAPDFLMQLHEFLDRYSLHVAAKNPVARRKPEPRRERQVERMTEEEQLEMAMQASLAACGPGASAADAQADPDALTRSIDDVRGAEDENTAMLDPPRSEEDATQYPDAGAVTRDDKDQAQGQDQGQGQGQGGQDASSAAFAAISSRSPHVQPAPGPGTTRIQFRHPSGRVVRRFALAEPVRRLYEWLKAEPLEGKAGVEFQLVAMGTNLIERLNRTVEAAGLNNGTVMVEFIEE